MVEFFAGVFAGVANGMVGDRLRRLFERKANPNEPPQETEIEILRDIRTQLANNDPQSRQGQGSDTIINTTWVVQKPPFWTTVWKQGRKNMRLTVPVDTKLYVNGPGGQYSIQLLVGQERTVNLPDGSWVALDPSELNDTATVQVRLEGGD